MRRLLPFGQDGSDSSSTEDPFRSVYPSNPIDLPYRSFICPPGPVYYFAVPPSQDKCNYASYLRFFKLPVPVALRLTCASADELSKMGDGMLMEVCVVGGNAVSAFLSWRLQATNACDVTLVWKSGFDTVSQYGISFK